MRRTGRIMLNAVRLLALIALVVTALQVHWSLVPVALVAWFVALAAHPRWLERREKVLERA